RGGIVCGAGRRWCQPRLVALVDGPSWGPDRPPRQRCHSVRELVAAGAGLTLLPCIGGDTGRRVVRIAAAPIAELETEQWLVSHHEERHTREVRTVLNRLTKLLRKNAPLFAGDVGSPP